MTLYAGELVLIKATIEVADASYDPTTVKITIHSKTKTGLIVQSEDDMTKTSVGKYQYVWDSSGQDAGSFFAKIHAQDSAPGNWEFLRIVLV